MNNIRVICDKCGKEAPIDHDKSTSTFTAYDTNSKCRCGGNWIMDTGESLSPDSKIGDNIVEEVVEEAKPTTALISAESETTLANISQVVKAIIEDNDDYLISNIDIYLIRTVKNELNRVVRYLGVLDKIEDLYFKKIDQDLADYPIAMIQEVVGFIQTSIDRSNNIINSIARVKPEMPSGANIIIGPNSNVQISRESLSVNAHGSSDSDSKLSAPQRERVRNYVESLLSGLNTIENNSGGDN